MKVETKKSMQMECKKKQWLAYPRTLFNNKHWNHAPLSSRENRQIFELKNHPVKGRVKGI